MKGLRYTVFALFIVAGLGLLWLSLSMRPSPNDAVATTKATTSGKLLVTTTTATVDTTSTPATTITPASTTTTPTPIGTPTPQCGLAWRGVDSPNPGIFGNQLYGISSVSPNDIWAVGYEEDATPRAADLTLVQHWDGSSWNTIPSPNFGPTGNILQAVDALSANDVWAVGQYDGPGSLVHALAMHWDGTQWTSSYDLDVDRHNFLYGVTAIAPNDVWAVGDYSTLTCCYTVTWHWNGTSWTLVNSPNPSGSLYGVAAVGSSNVWAVGISNGQPLTLHWDGTQMNIVLNPNLPNGGLLSSVTAISATDIWAVGNSTSNNIEHSLIEHWDGVQWGVVTSPDVGSLNGVNALSTNDVWAVSSNSANDFLHWNGTTWSTVPGSSIPNGTLNGILALSPDDVLTVGTTSRVNINGRTLIQRYNDPCSPHLVGHVNWQGPLPQPSIQQRLPITLTLKSGTIEVNYAAQNTNSNGYFEVSLAALPAGSYRWRAKGPKYLANSGMVTLPGMLTADLDLGRMMVGDANNDNQVSTVDFNITKVSFGRSVGEPAYDERAEFTGDCVVTIADFNLLRRNFSLSGAPPI